MTLEITKKLFKARPPGSLGLEGLRAAVSEPSLSLGLPFIFTAARGCRDGQGRQGLSCLLSQNSLSLLSSRLSSGICRMPTATS